MLLDLASPLANRPISEMAAAEILIILKKYEKVGLREAAKRLRGRDWCRIPTGSRDAAGSERSDIRAAGRDRLARNVSSRGDHRRKKQLGALLLDIDQCTARPTLKAALDVSVGSKADLCTRGGDVRCYPRRRPGDRWRRPFRNL